ncbi:MAG: hypothetical protein M3R08_10780 [Bacteroidota bacterium]|nr:hypothetical protein [Bacteroidota bacterium]
MDNKQDKPHEQPQAPIVLMGGMAFTLAELLEAENNPEVMAKIQAWLDKKDKAHEQAQKRKRRTPRRRK